MSMPNQPKSFPENEDMDPVGDSYPEQTSHDPDLGEDPPHPENAPFDEPDIPLDEDSERVVRPE